MKKVIICLIGILILASIILVILISNNYKQVVKLKQQNASYESYLNKELLGTDITTIINQAMNANVKNNIEKDEKGFFIPNDTNSIKIELILYNEQTPITHQMETIDKVGMKKFIQNFNTINFKCSKIEYHKKTQSIRKIVFKQIEE